MVSLGYSHITFIVPDNCTTHFLFLYYEYRYSRFKLYFHTKMPQEYTLFPFFLCTSTGFCTCRGLTIRFEKHNTHRINNLSNTSTEKYNNTWCSQHKPYTLGAMLVSGYQSNLNTSVNITAHKLQKDQLKYTAMLNVHGTRTVSNY